MRKQWLFLVFFFLVVLARNTNATCISNTTIANNYYVNTSITLCYNQIYFSNNLTVNNNSIMIDGNGTSLIGNLSSNSRGIMSSGIFNNVTINNITIINYAYNIRLTAYNSTIINSVIDNNSNAGIYSLGSINLTINNTVLNGSNSLYLSPNGLENIVNNVFSGINTIFLYQGTNPSYYITNNVFNGVNVTSYAFSILVNGVTASFINITGNTFNNYRSTIQLSSGTNITVANNVWHNQTIGSAIIANYPSLSVHVDNLTIINNTVDLGDTDFFLQSASNVLVTNNNLTNCYTGDYNGNNYDGCIVIGHNSTNVTVQNNIINNFGDYGVLVRSSNNVTIRNNVFSHATDAMRQQFPLSASIGETPAFIVIPTLYKWYIDAGPGNAINSIACENYSIVGNSTIGNVTCTDGSLSSNIQIYGNNYSTNDTAYIFYATKTTGLSFDFKNYWSRTIGVDDNYMSPRTYIIPNNLTMLSSYDYNAQYNYSVPFLTSGGGIYKHNNYSITNKVITIQNINNTQGGYTGYNITSNVSLTNLSYPYNSIYDNTNKIFLYVNFSNVSLTLQPLQQVSVVNGFCDTIPTNNMIVQSTNTICNGTGNYGNIINMTINTSGLEAQVYDTPLSSNLTEVFINYAESIFGTNSTVILVKFIGLAAPNNDYYDLTNNTYQYNLTSVSVYLQPGQNVFIYNYDLGNVNTSKVCTTSSGSINSLLVFTGFFSIIVLVVVMGFIINAFMKESLDAELIKVTALILVMTGMIIGVGILIFSGLASSCI